jgi:hypothetical protein
MQLAVSLETPTGKEAALRVPREMEAFLTWAAQRYGEAVAGRCGAKANELLLLNEAINPFELLNQVIHDKAENCCAQVGEIRITT